MAMFLDMTIRYVSSEYFYKHNWVVTIYIIWAQSCIVTMHLKLNSDG